ncbi:MAG TPA: hypothetical protein VFG68_22905 [Fimbriiglobus sp.]|nr:hypothetical protein [Fimbriiglobus sp.]
MPVHRIRLRGFWEATPLADGRTRHVRRFGKPRTLDPGETAWVVGDAGPATVYLNGEMIGQSEAAPFAFEVTARLQTRNELAIEGTLGEVALEVRGAG